MATLSLVLLAMFMIINTVCDSPCPLLPQELSEVQTDQVHIVATPSTTNTQEVSYEYSYEDPLNRIPRIAIGINHFETQPSKVLGFEVNIVRSTTAGILFDVVFNSNGNWKDMRINFLSTTRSDLELGNAQYEADQSQPGERFAIPYQFQNQWETPYLKIKPLLSSMHLTSLNEYSVGLHLLHTQFTEGGIIFYFSSNNTEVQHVKMDIVVFDVFNPAFRYADGSVSQNYIFTRQMIEIPKHKINELKTFIFGVISFDISISVPITLHTSLDRFFLEIGLDNRRNEINHITVNYLILSIFSKCGACEEYVYELNGRCIKSCPQGFRARDGKCQQIKCRPGFYYSSSQCLPCQPQSTVFDCIYPCRYGLRLEGDKCVPICSQEVEIYHEDQCICKNGMHRIDGVCQFCEQGKRYDHNAQMCKPICSMLSRFENNRCVCKDGYHLINGQCQTCSPNQIYDQRWKACIIPCRENEYYNGIKCECLHGFYLIGDRCGQCSGSQRYDPQALACKLRCSANERLFEGKCICRSQFERRDGICVPNCGAYEYFNGNSCVCANSYYLINGVCGRCAPDQVYVSQKKICRHRCKLFQIYDGQKCVCQFGYHFIDDVCRPICQLYEIYDGENCFCAQGFYLINGKCGVCSQNEQYDSVNQVCIAVCDAYEIFNGERCVCQETFFLINGKCGKCYPDEEYDPQTQKCVSKCSDLETFNGARCVCKSGLYRIDGVCQQCGAGQIFSARYRYCVPRCSRFEEYSVEEEGCVCKKGFVKIDNKCSPCPPGTRFDDNFCQCIKICGQNEILLHHKCQCAGGYSRNKYGACSKNRCPDNSYFNEVTQCCICFQNFILDPRTGYCEKLPDCPENSSRDKGRCKCFEGFHYDENGFCIKCLEEQIFDGYKCHCKGGMVKDQSGKCRAMLLPTCQQFEVYDENEMMCVCRQGYQIIKGQCTKIGECEQNSYWNGEKCACEEGYQDRDGVCTKVEVQPPDCKYNSFFDGTKCVCNDGFFQLAPGVCASCAPLQVWNGRKCTYQIECWIGYAWDEERNYCVPQAQVCGQNGEWNGVQCVCKPTYNVINGYCQQCPPGTRYDGSKCSLAQGGQCLIPNEVKVNGDCVCEEGYHRYNGICLQCPSISTWNGRFCEIEDVESACLSITFARIQDGKCKCMEGFRMVNAMCVPSGFYSPQHLQQQTFIPDNN